MVDASVISAFILKEPGWRNLTDYLLKCLTVDHALKEVSNAIWKARMRKLISIDDAEKKFTAFRKLVGVNIELFPEDKLIDVAFKIALEEDITVYDALYIALAERKKATLITLDKRQAEISKRRKVDVKLIKI